MIRELQLLLLVAPFITLAIGWFAGHRAGRRSTRLRLVSLEPKRTSEPPWAKDVPLPERPDRRDRR